MLLQANNISVNFGPHTVLEDVSMKITTHSRVALVGANGAGKSTLLKCLLGEIDPQSGTVTKASDMDILCLTQNPELTFGNTLNEELYSVFDRIKGKFQDYEIDSKIGQMLKGLGFQPEDSNQKVEDFSGGWQMRINLAKVLLQEADILLMDEPTNHLDMKSCEWLENFLKTYPNGILIVSHDRRFIDEVATEIVELERGKLTTYHGNYSQYQEQRRLQRENQTAAAQRQKKSMAKTQEFVDRFKAKSSKSTQAKSKAKQLAKIEIIEVPKGELKKLSFKFPMKDTSNREVLEIKDLSKSFGDKILFNKISAQLEWTKEKPHRVFILGANGCGKTTLFKILMGLEEYDEGSIKFGSRVQLGYYAQHQLQILDPKKTALKTLEDIMPPTPQGEIRAILGKFLFSNEQVFKNVEVLSGGEKARLAMAKLMVGGPNTLLLDEPTNHLDTPAQEAIEAAIQSYQGSVICVSHDRYLIENNATQIWEFHKGSLITFDGSYHDYLEKRTRLLKESEKPEIVVEEKPKEKTHHEVHQERKVLEKEHKNLEKSIKQLNLKKEKLEEKIIDPEISTDYKKLENIGKELKEIEAEIETSEFRWLELNEIINAVVS
jgi:ATP-binding cassette, subfamily F, member 3